MQQKYVMRAVDAARQEMRIVPELRRVVRFQHLNLMDGSYPVDRDFDVIFCRNILIYFSKATQDGVLRRLCSHLRKGGFLILGHSESLAGSDQPSMRQIAPTIFRRRVRELRMSAAAQSKIRVLIVDDSASVRQTLTSIITGAPDLEVMATAGDPFVAAQRIHEEVPDVIILDVEMPRMDGITFLRKIMAQRPIPTILCSTLLEAGSETLLDALEAGAVDVILKPRIDTKQFFTESQVRIWDAVQGGEAGDVRGARAGRRIHDPEEAHRRRHHAAPHAGPLPDAHDRPGRLHRRLDRRDGIAARGA